MSGSALAISTISPIRAQQSSAASQPAATTAHAFSAGVPESAGAAGPDKVPAALLAQFPEVSQVTIDGAFGGWKKAQAEHFGDGGFFDRIYKP